MKYMKLKLAHMTNIFNGSPDSIHSVTQPITLETMRRAANFSSDIVDVDLLACCYENEINLVPEDFLKTECLSRSVQDEGKFSVYKK